MRRFSLVLGAVLAAGAFLAAGVQACRADAPAAADATPLAAAPAAPLAATPDEESDYARREAASPEAKEFEGGHAGFLIAFLVVAALVLLIVLMAKAV